MDEEEKPKFHNSWTDKYKNTLYLESTKGFFNAAVHKREEDFEDRRFTIRINDSQRFAFSHDMQLSLLKNVLCNDMLPHRFIQNCEKFLHLIHEIKGERKRLEASKYNIKIGDYVDRKLWNCGDIK